MVVSQESPQGPHVRMEGRCPSAEGRAVSLRCTEMGTGEHGSILEDAGAWEAVFGFYCKEGGRSQEGFKKEGCAWLDLYL